MAGTHNFLPFDSTNSNMTTDANYSTDANRLNGVSNGIADPLSFNKAVHQASIMAAALAQIAANNGQTFDDTNLSNLITALTNVLATLSTTSYADRATHALFNAADVGAISYCAAQSTPSSATYTASGTGNLLGGYHYREVFVTGYNNPDGTHYVRGFSPAAQRSSYDVSPSSQQVSITNLPLGSAGCIGRAIYRSAANGAAGSEKYCGIIWDNSTTSYTDNLVDSQLGSGMPTVQGVSVPANVPTSNTTGTTVPIPTALQVGASSASFATKANIDDLSFPAGIYSVNGELIGNGWSYNVVIKGVPRTDGYQVEVAIPFDGGGYNGITYRVSGATDWGPWKKPDAANADTSSNSVAVTSAGLRNIVELANSGDSTPTGLANGTLITRPES